MPDHELRCPECRHPVEPQMPACPECGERLYVEHPGAVRRDATAAGESVGEETDRVRRPPTPPPAYHERYAG